MIREPSLQRVVTYIHLSQCSLAGNLRPRRYARNNRGYVIDRNSATPRQQLLR